MNRMNDTKELPKVLFTTKLSEEQQKLLQSPHFQFSAHPFITFEFVDTSKWLSTIPPNYDAWVFTSKRAVKAVKPVLNSLSIPEHIFAVGKKTAKKITDLQLGAITPESYNLQSLAEKINEFHLNHIVHFCGNLRSGNLPELLDDESTKVTSIEVYQTRLISKKIDAEFDAIVFMSPSAVRAFKQQNEIPGKSAVFCIGPSTAKALEQQGVRSNIVSNQSTLDSLAETINKFYQ